MGKLYGELGEDKKERAAYEDAGLVIRRLAETIEGEGLREGFFNGRISRRNFGKIKVKLRRVPAQVNRSLEYVLPNVAYIQNQEILVEYLTHQECPSTVVQIALHPT